jgi:two-component system OmpR family response regulator
MTRQNFKMLLVEDDPNLGLVTQEALELQGFLVTLAEDGDKAERNFLKNRFDLCIIDVMLPVKDGFSLAKAFRKIDPDIPIIFLTARALKEDKIEGFHIGCDDYITKPFSIEELVLRIQAVLRRSHVGSKPQENQVFQIGDFTFDANRQALKVGNDAKRLTYKESELLRLLCLHKNKILERDVALNLIWNDDSFFTARSMDVYITKLRRYLKADPQIHIVNIHGKGFKLSDK